MSEPGTWNRVAVFSAGIARIPRIEQLLGADHLVFRPTDAEAASIDAVVGWGEKPNTAAARAYARRNDLPYWRAEDGFLRSVDIGASGEPPLSIVLDDRGIYYDARRPSRLEHLIASDAVDDPELLARAAAARATIIEAQLSKYNNSPPKSAAHVPSPRGGRARVGGHPETEARPSTPEADPRPRVLVVDQTAGDLSIPCGLATEGAFHAMLDAAIDENPDAEIVVKIHPDVLAGKKKGHLEHITRTRANGRVRILADLVNPIALLATVDRAYVVTSQLGLEALLTGVPVTCFGAPFYAGWGLTDDRARLPRRGVDRTLDQLFAATYLLYPRYLDPDDDGEGTLEAVIDHLLLQRTQFTRNQGRIFCFGFRLWKHNWVRAYLRCPGNEIRFPRSARHAERLGFDGDSHALVWGQRAGDDVAALAARFGVDVWRMEDGFLRSVGLGSDLATPASLVVDRRGIYYDPSGPSELEEILATAQFTDVERDRARRLRETMVSAGVSKYNVGASAVLPIPEGARVVLVPGQVEDDASIELGCPAIRTNLDLLAAAREASPDAFIVFKPHPDVLSGNRAGAVPRADALAHCDHIEESASIADCLAAADEVHTLTSLVGFEALLRGLRVVVHGQPFYAGWGLTEDRHPVSRRARRLTIDELVAGALLRYPRYLDRETGRFTTPEAVIAQLRRERDTSPSARALKMPWARRQLRKLVHYWRGVVHAP